MLFWSFHFFAKYAKAGFIVLFIAPLDTYNTYNISASMLLQ